MINRRTQPGFTIIELLIATTVFSLVLMVFLAAFLRIGQLFYKGVYMSNVQETARNVIQGVSDDLQFYPDMIRGATGQYYYCIGNHRYSYHLGVQVTSAHSSNYGIARENITTCNPLTGPNAQPVDVNNYTELLDPGMQVNKFDLTAGNSSVTVVLHLVYYGGDNSVLYSPSGLTPAWQAPDARCTGAASSTQYCATAEYNSTVLQNW